MRAAHLARNGVPAEKVPLFHRHKGGYAKGVAPLPPAYRRLIHAHPVTIGGHRWDVIVGRGHAPEHASLWCPELNVLIAGDQVLPKISTNVGVWPNEPQADALLKRDGVADGRVLGRPQRRVVHLLHGELQLVLQTFAFGFGAPERPARRLNCVCQSARKRHGSSHLPADAASPAITTQPETIRKRYAATLVTQFIQLFSQVVAVGIVLNLMVWVLVVASSSYVYVALADLIPQLQKRLSARETSVQVLWLMAGIGLVSVATQLMHVH